MVMRKKCLKYKLDGQNNGFVCLDEIKIDFNIEGADYELVIGKGEFEVCINLRNEGIISVALDDIVFIEPDNVGKSAKSNNKRIHFRSRKSGVLSNFTARTDIQDKLKLAKSDFVEVFRGIYVNVRTKGFWDGHVLNVECMNDETGMLETVGLKVSKGKVNRVKSVFSKQ